MDVSWLIVDFFPPSTFIQNSGMPPVDMLRDPRIGRLRTKFKETDLPVPKFKVVTPPHWLVLHISYLAGVGQFIRLEYMFVQFK